MIVNSIDFVKKGSPPLRLFFAGLIVYAAFSFSPPSLDAASTYPWEPMMCSFEKDIPIGFSENYMLPPNVLLLVDTSGSMTFVPGLEGQSDSGYIIEKGNTYGDGSRPLCISSSYRSWSNYTAYGRTSIYFGRDMDKANNDPSEPNNYHPLLTYIGHNDLSGVDYLSSDDIEEILSVTEKAFSGLSDNEKERYFAKDSGGNYLFPNDSRMYKLKLVLWKIFNDPSLISNLNVGLSSYHQDKGISIADWYENPPKNGHVLKDRQCISWGGGEDGYADLNLSFGSTDSQDHLDNLKKWFDGIEIRNNDGKYLNDELRADGATPLANSIYDYWEWKWYRRYPYINYYYPSDSGHRYNSSDRCACDFFHHIKDGYNGDDPVIRGYCQDNWLIVLTDGEDTVGGDAVKAVEYLYKESSKWKIMKTNIQPVKTMVIGFIDPEKQEDLADTLNEMADYGDDGIANSSQAAYFATDVDGLLSAFSEIFTKIQEKKGSGSAPLVSPGSRLAGETASVYVAPFIPDSTGQWEGHLDKYSLVNDEVPDEPDWDAGDILDDRAASSRTIYTVGSGDWWSSVSDSGMVDFSAANVSKLRQLMFDRTDLYDGSYYPTDWTDFINWVRGEDDASTGERWKLADIYHGGLVEIGAPAGQNTSRSYTSFADENVSRDELLYVQANDGMLHAFNSLDNDEGDAGSERWAFIPPDVLYSGKLVGLKGGFNLNRYWGLWKYKYRLDFDHSSTGNSVPRYMLDGPIVAEDVFDADKGVSGSWRTILFAELGYAGAGLYAVDVTDPDEPQFLWALDNVIYINDDDEPDVYLGWDSTDGKRLSDSRSYVYYWNNDGNGKVSMNKYVHNGDDLPSDLDYRNLKFTLSVPAIGSIMIPGKNGSDTQEKWVALMGNGTNMGIGSDNEGTVYVMDILTGKILKTITKEDLSPKNMKRVVTPISVLKTNNYQRIEKFYFGDDDGTITEVNADENEWTNRKIINTSGSGGLSYGIELGSFRNNTWLFFMTGDLDPKVVKTSNSNYFIACNADSASVPLARGDLTSINPSDVDSLSSSSDPGWYFELTGDPVAPPKLYGGYLFFSTFVKNEEDLCKVGDSRLYIMDALTAKGAWGSGHKKYVDLEGVQISGITIADGKVYIGAIGHEGEGTDKLPDEMSGLNASFSNNLLVFDVPDDVGSGNDANIKSGQMVPKYWREWLGR